MTELTGQVPDAQDISEPSEGIQTREQEVAVEKPLTAEQTKAVGRAVLVDVARKVHTAFEDKPAGGLEHAKWLGVLMKAKDGVFVNSENTKVEEPADVESLQLFVYVSQTGTQACQELNALPDGAQRHKLTRVLAKNPDGTFTCETSNGGEPIKVPPNAFCDAFALQIDLSEIPAEIAPSAAQDELLQNHYALITDNETPVVDRDTAKEAIKGVPVITGEASAAFIDNLIRDTASSGEVSHEVQRQLQKLAEIQAKMRTSVVVDPQDFGDMVEVMVGTELGSVVTDTLNRKIDTLGSQITILRTELEGIPSNQEKERKAKQKQIDSKIADMTAAQNQLAIQEQMKQMGGSQREVIVNFVAKIQNGESAPGAVDRLNDALQNGNSQRLIEEMVTQMREAGMAQKDIDEAKGKVDAWGDKMRMIGSGAALIILLMIMQSIQQGSKG